MSRKMMLAVPGALFLGALCAPGTPAKAAMTIDRLVIDLSRDGPRRQDIEIGNSGKERLYVRVTPLRVERPGRRDENRVEVGDPQQGGLLVTPRRLILEPGQRKVVRVLNLRQAGKGDRIYRVSIVPVLGRPKAKGVGIKVLYGYRVLVIVRPVNPIARLVARRTAKGISFRNGGNTNLLLFRGKQCNAAGKSCRKVAGRRLYAGTSWTLRLTRPGPVIFMVRDAKGVTERRF